MGAIQKAFKQRNAKRAEETPREDNGSLGKTLPCFGIPAHHAPTQGRGVEQCVALTPSLHLRSIKT